MTVELIVVNCFTVQPTAFLKIVTALHSFSISSFLVEIKILRVGNNIRKLVLNV